jgi:hypothetical protein
MALVCGLTLGDYLLWNWSLTNNHDVPALVSGLTLPPLASERGQQPLEQRPAQSADPAGSPAPSRKIAA